MVATVNRASEARIDIEDVVVAQSFEHIHALEILAVQVHVACFYGECVNSTATLQCVSRRVTDRRSNTAERQRLRAITVSRLRPRRRRHGRAVQGLVTAACHRVDAIKLAARTGKDRRLGTGEAGVCRRTGQVHGQRISIRRYVQRVGVITGRIRTTVNRRAVKRQRHSVSNHKVVTALATVNGARKVRVDVEVINSSTAADRAREVRRVQVERVDFRTAVTVQCIDTLEVLAVQRDQPCPGRRKRIRRINSAAITRQGVGRRVTNRRGNTTERQRLGTVTVRAVGPRRRRYGRAVQGLVTAACHRVDAVKLAARTGKDRRLGTGEAGVCRRTGQVHGQRISIRRYVQRVGVITGRIRTTVNRRAVKRQRHSVSNHKVVTALATVNRARKIAANIERIVQRTPGEIRKVIECVTVECASAGRPDCPGVSCIPCLQGVIGIGPSVQLNGCTAERTQRRKRLGAIVVAIHAKQHVARTGINVRAGRQSHAAASRRADVAAG